MVTDNAYAVGAAIAAPAASPRTNIKTGNLIPSNVMGEMDLKSDDGSPVGGNLVLSAWQAAGGARAAPSVAACATGMAGPPLVAAWNNGQAVAPGGAIGANCGGATLL